MINGDRIICDLYDMIDDMITNHGYDIDKASDTMLNLLEHAIQDYQDDNCHE